MDSESLRQPITNNRPILPLPKERFGKAKGILSGGILAGFLTVLGLIVRRIFKELM